MAVLSRRCVSDLAPGLVLAPERYDPRQEALQAEGLPLDALADLPGGLQIEAEPGDPAQVRVLDTGHVAWGFVPFPPAPGPWSALGSARRRLLAGDVVISRLRPYLGQVAWIDPALCVEGGAPIALVGSPELVVLRPRSGSLAYLVPYLLSEPVQAALVAAQEGGHHPRVPRAVIEGLRVPAALLAEAAAQARSVEAAVNTLRQGAQAMVALRRSAAPPSAPAVAVPRPGAE
jgi:hypothetical protein